MTLFINEFHYDNDGTDAGEFIELAGTAGLDLSGYSLVLYNGNGGAVYNTLNLSGVFADMQNGFGVLSFAYPVNGIQNGSPDGIALVGPGATLLQFLSYEGSFVGVGGAANGVTSTDIGVSEPGNQNGTSLALTGTGTFTWVLDANDTPGAINNGQTFGGGATVSISDVSLAEGNSGVTLFTFTVTNSAATSAFTVDFATADGTALNTSDYVSNAGTLNFAGTAGETKQVTIQVTGDADGEANETFFVNLSNLVGAASLGDGQGLGTIQNDDSTITAIHTIQGAGHTSAYVDQTVTTKGIVTAVDSNGFYLQSADADVDADVSTSEGIFVFTSSAPTVAVGDGVQVTGTVSEFIPGGAVTNNLSTTQISGSPVVVVESSGNALPTAVIMGTAGRAAPTQVIDNDNFATFDPAQDGIDYFESLEGMRVTVPTPLVVAGTNGFGEIFTVADGGAGATGLSTRGAIISKGSVGDGLAVTNTGTGADYNPERIQIDADSTVTPGGTPAVNVGATLSDVTGVLGYNFGNFEVIPTSAITVANAGTLAAETSGFTPNADDLTIASYNVLNLDPNDSDGDTDVADGRFTAIAQHIVTNLKAPDIIALQEVQDNNGSVNDSTVSASATLQALIDAIAANGGPTYSFLDNPFVVDDAVGGQPGGNIRVAYLYNDARVDLVGAVATTPDAAADFVSSRVPLVATFAFNGEDVTVVNNHFSSKGGSSPLFGAVQPSLNGSADERLVQAQNVADYVTSLGPDAKVVVLGDLNEFTNEESLAPLTAAGLDSMTLTLPETERYTYVFDGNGQSLDQIFVSDNLVAGADLDVVHLNAEFAEADSRASDHDPSVLSLNLPENANFTLQILHFSDGEAGTLAPVTAPNLAALVDAFEDVFQFSITLAGGDTFLPGPFLAAGTDPSVVPVLNALTGSTVGAAGAAPGVVDTAIHNLIGVEASGIGNHEWDLGSNVYLSSLTGGGFVGAQYASISANLVLNPTPDVPNSADPLNARFTQTVGTGTLANEEAQDLKARVAPSAVIKEGDEYIGLVGATTQILESISSPTAAEILGFPFGAGANGETNNMVLLAAQLQPVIDDLIAQGVNKIVLLSHLQQIQFEKELAPLLRGVDVILAAGSNTRLGDADDVAVEFPGHAADFADTYPIITAGADGKTTVIVNTDNEYTYLGRLVVEFDDNGEIVLQSLTDNVAINGAYASTASNVAAAWGVAEADLGTTAFADGTRGDKVKQLTDAVNSVITAKDGNVFGYSNVYLEGERIQVRNQETNLGNLTADANAAVARDALGLEAEQAIVSIKNGGGIRAQIGTILNNPDGTVTKVAPEVGGEVSQLDVENALRFNNRLMVFDTTPQGLLNILNSPNALAPNSGGFIQIGGVQFSYDPTKAAGGRVQDVALINELGEVTARIADNGVVLAGAPALITAVALNFTANGGDGYLIKSNADNFRFLLDNGTLSAPVDEALNFTSASIVPANAVGEQAALADYFGERYGTRDTAYDVADTAQALDTRIQNQAVRPDTVLEGDVVQVGTSASETLTGTGDDDLIRALAGNDSLDGGLGNDTLVGGLGADQLTGGEGLDTASYERATGSVSASLSTNRGFFGEAVGDRFSSIENLEGSAFNDVLEGNNFANVIDGGAGNDRIEGRGGLDTLLGGTGNDNFVFTSTQKYAVVDGGDGYDSLVAGAANTKLHWANLVSIEAIRGDGYANVVLLAGSAADTINLVDTDVSGLAEINGGAGNDSIMGSAGADRIVGGGGNDMLRGVGTDNVLVGGLGIDEMEAGAGDRFVFAKNESSRTAANADRILGFDGDADNLIDLTLIDANSTNADPNDGFSFIDADPFTLQAGQLRLVQTGVAAWQVEGDTNGDGRADFIIRLLDAVTVDGGDFLL